MMSGFLAYGFVQRGLLAGSLGAGGLRAFRGVFGAKTLVLNRRRDEPRLFDGGCGSLADLV